MTKMTYSVAIDNALAGNLTDEVVERLHDLQTQLAKRGSGKKSLTKTQKENEVLKEDMFAFVSENGQKRASEVAVYFGISGQKASALLKQLVDGGRLEKVMEKKVAFFRVAEGM